MQSRWIFINLFFLFGQKLKIEAGMAHFSLERLHKGGFWGEWVETIWLCTPSENCHNAMIKYGTKLEKAIQWIRSLENNSVARLRRKKNQFYFVWKQLKSLMLTRWKSVFTGQRRTDAAVMLVGLLERRERNTANGVELQWIWWTAVSAVSTAAVLLYFLQIIPGK